MNDFTKEELEMIADDVLSGMYDTLMDEHKKQSFYKKVLSMIDNYCEHKDEE